ncbi:hypothetical protein SVAN01_06053 [Stagonosporopsis vannaccii]|nr:hypothetical protein SVAN01_06053 [Stagonosporopsis vannaccii]
MHSTLTLIIFAALTEAGSIPLLPPILPPLSIRETLQNNTGVALFGQNPTQFNPRSDANYKDTVAWRVYIAFLVLGILTAVVMPPIVCSPDILYHYRSMRAKKQTEKRKNDVEVATAKIREVLQHPKSAHLRAERLG